MRKQSVTKKVPLLKQDTSDLSKNESIKFGEHVANPELPNSTKKILERLSFLHNQLKELYESNKKQFDLKFKEQHFKKLVEPLEMLHEHRSYIDRTQYHLTGAHLLHSTIDALFTLFFYHSKYKRELKSMIQKHKENESTLDKLYKSYSELDAKRLNLKDEIAGTKYIYFLFSDTEDASAEEYEDEAVAIIMYVPADAIIPGTLVQVLESLDKDNIAEVYNGIMSYLDSGRIDENILTMILSIGMKCAYFGNSMYGHKIIKRAIDLLRSHCNKKTLKYNLLPLADAFIYKYDGKLKEAAKIMNTVIDEVRESNKFTDPQVMNLLMHLAYLVEKWNNKLGASNVMEEIIMNLSENLPDSELNWLKASTMTARIFNNQMKPEQSMYYLIKAIDYYHEKMFGEVSSTNKPIHEIADDLKNRGNASATLIQALSPRLGYLPPAMMDCLNELCITFALRNNHNAVKVVEKYITDCKNAHQEFVIADDEEDKGMTLFQMAKGKAYNTNIQKVPKRLEVRRTTQTFSNETRKSFLGSSRASITESISGKMKKLKKKVSKDSGKNKSKGKDKTK